MILGPRDIDNILFKLKESRNRYLSEKRRVKRMKENKIINFPSQDEFYAHMVKNALKPFNASLLN